MGVNTFNETVIRLRAVKLPQPDAQGNDQYDWTNPDQVTYTNVAVSPVTTTETNNTAEPRDQTTAMYRINSRRGVRLDFVAYDRAVWRGATWDVQGVPEQWPHPTAVDPAVHHTEVDIERVES